MPKELRPVLQEAHNLFIENCVFKTELNELADKQEAEALELILKIDKNWKGNQICWDKINYYLKHKELPKSTIVPISEWTMDKLIKQANLLQSAVSRQLKRFKENSEKLLKEKKPTEIKRLERLIIKQERDIIEKREKLLLIKIQIDDKTRN